MPLGGWIMVAWFWVVILVGVGLLIWGWRTGGFEDVEEAKYLLFEEREPQAREDLRRERRERRAGP